MPSILGGGISGLSAAYYLTRNFVSPITIYEASSRLGGWIRTESHDEKGFIFETGPRTIRPKGPAAANTLQLIEHLNVDVEPIYASHTSARNRMIYAKGMLCMLPNKINDTLETTPPFSKPLALYVLREIFKKKPQQKLDDESIYSFVERRFGTEVAKYAISSMICGICAGDSKEISVRFLMNDLFEKEQKWGGVIKGLLYEAFSWDNIRKMLRNEEKKEVNQLFKTAKESNWSMYRVRGGLETLPRTMTTFLKNNFVDIKTVSECTEIIFQDNSAVLRINGDEVKTDHVISSIPSYKLAPLLSAQHPSLSNLLKEIEYVDVAVVNLQYAVGNLLEHEAFGFLVPPAEKLPILGIVFDSCCFDMRGNTVLTVMMGGKWFEKNFGKNPTQKELLDTALKSVKNILKIKYEPKLSRVHILRKCIPQYVVGHKARVKIIRDYIQTYKLPLSLCGAAYDGVGVNDVILSAKTQIDSLVRC